MVHSVKVDHVQLSEAVVTNTPVRVLVVAEHVELQDALVDLFGDDPEFELAGIARTVADAVGQARCAKPDVLLIDLDMAGGVGAQVIAEIAEEMSHVTQIAMSSFGDRETLKRIHSLGAHRHLRKGADVVDLMKGVIRR
jgi:DNA-binding NarL/FixJ family response regulator